MREEQGRHGQARREDLQAGAAGMWRWLDFLPVKPPVRYPLPVGGTPLLAPPVLREELGLDLWLKDETRGPSASNKDRATALVIQHALGERAGAPATISCASTGNVAVSLAVGAAAAGLRAVIFVPSQVDPHKLALMRLAGATVVKVREGYAAAFRLSRQAAEAFGWHDRNTGVNPLTVEGKKTAAFEIWEQLGGTMPDVVVAPVGDGVTLAALDRGFRELAAVPAAAPGGAAPGTACGAAGAAGAVPGTAAGAAGAVPGPATGAPSPGVRLPRIIGVQAAGADPVRRAWLWGTDRIEPLEPRTIADGIAVGAPIYGAEALAAVRASGGGFVAVSDDELLAAVARLASRAGVLAEPAGAAAFAGVVRAVAEGLIAPGERVVVLVTGSALKTPGLVTAALQAGAPEPGPVVEIPADLDALREALDLRA
ncbi:MAG: pyridoxal-phosphate dependent enzyme [Thermaerobacter sp.]